MGEGYFIALSEHFLEPHQKEKMLLMAKVEGYAAKAILPLIRKYKLIPRANRLLKDIGKKGLKRIAPESDIGMLKTLTDHEVAAIEFARLEMEGNTNSIDPLMQYMEN